MRPGLTDVKGGFAEIADIVIEEDLKRYESKQWFTRLRLCQDSFLPTAEHQSSYDAREHQHCIPPSRVWTTSPIVCPHMNGEQPDVRSP
jgi:hypothetical protein